MWLVRLLLDDQSKNITLTATDPDDEVFQYTILSLPPRGRLLDTATGQQIDAVPYTFQNVFRKDVMVTFEPVLYESGNNYATFTWARVVWER